MRRALMIGVILLASAGITVPAHAFHLEEAVVSENPSDWTPHVLNGTVYSLAAIGDRIVVGGKFTRISEADGSGIMPQAHLFAFDRDTGEIDQSFLPVVDGPVFALAPGGSGTVYVGGRFQHVNGAEQSNLTRLHVDDGEQVDDVDELAVRGDEVRTLDRHGRHLYVGGAFRRIGNEMRKALARVDIWRDRPDPDFDIEIAEKRGGRLRVQDVSVSNDGTRLVIAGTFTKVEGQTRQQLAVVDTAAEPPELASWSTDTYSRTCNTRLHTSLRSVDVAPDDSYFVVATAGWAGRPGAMCYTATRFELDGQSGNHEPTWVNETGGDSLYSIVATNAAIYVGGHQRWMDNPKGRSRPGPGAVSRPGIAALDPETGKALPWNPTRTRGVGVQAFLVTSEGLYVGSDTERLGREYHGRVGLFPLG